MVLIQDLLLHIHNMDMALGTYTEPQLFQHIASFQGKMSSHGPSIQKQLYRPPPAALRGDNQL